MMTRLKISAVAVALTLLAIGCADLNTSVYRTEKLLADNGTAAVSGFNQYYSLATNGASPQRIDELSKTRDQIYDASRKLSAVLAVTEASRLAFSTNASDANKAVLQRNLGLLGANSGNVTSLVDNAMAPFSTVK